MSNDKEVLDRTAELGLDLVMLPPVVDNSLGHDGARRVLGLAGVNGNLRVVDRHAGANHVHRRKCDVDKQSVLVCGKVVVTTTVQVDESTPSVVVALFAPPPL